MLNTIKKLGELACVIEGEQNTKLTLDECAAIASVCGGVEKALDSFDEFGYYHYTQLFIYDHNGDFEHIKAQVFECCAECILEWRWHHIDESKLTDALDKSVGFDKTNYNNSVVIVANALRAIYNTCDESETCVERLKKAFVEGYKIFCGADTYEGNCFILNTSHNNKNYIIVEFDKR
jgi:hypothetical protein